MYLGLDTPVKLETLTIKTALGKMNVKLFMKHLCDILPG